MTSVYSFADVSLVLSHPNVGQCVLTGQGLGSVAISRTNDNSQHDVAADGSVMVSKILSKNGVMQIAIQQTSEAQAWLKKWYAYLMNAPTSEWARTNAVLKNPSANETFNMSGVSPQKRPDATFQQTGQQVTWGMMCAEITES